MTSGKQTVDFINVEDTAKTILDSVNFKKKNNYFPQIWHVASGKPKTVRSFAKHYWKKYNAKGEIFFNRIRKKDEKSFISDHKSIWKIK
jgi:nucleoside-diphosphate-sugar epimerase